MPLDPRAIERATPGLAQPAHSGELERRIGTLERATAGRGGFVVGDIKLTARAATDPGWLLCNGAAVSRVLYASLFTAIGTTYGAGDGSTTFNVPSLTAPSFTRYVIKA